MMMKQPLMFRRLLRDWVALPRSLDDGIAAGYVTREPKPGFVPLKGLSAISDVLPPLAYGDPGFAQVYNKEILRFRWLAAFSAFWSGISKAELEARLETYTLLTAAIIRQQDGTSTPAQQELTG
jgi:hypothetical protein